jgi:hypothetical protein
MTTTASAVLIDCDNTTLLQQIGRMNVLAISGGKFQSRRTGVTLPVRYGYAVTVDLAANDSYIVKRVFARGGRVWIKKTWTNVYCDEVGEIAYQASCYLDA